MQRYKRVFTFILLFYFVALAAKGQVASSPFSKFGIGDLYGTGLAQNQGMGGIGISNPSGSYLNSENPALLVFNKVTVFQGGLQLENRTATDGTNTQSFFSGNLNYLGLGLPVMPNGKWTTSVGLTPYSHVNYNISFSDVAGGSNVPINRQETGSGGIDQFYWSNGVTINKYLSVGVKASYLFSSIVTQDINKFANTSTTYASVYVRDYFHGLNFSGGISFHKDSLFRKNYRLNIGAVYSLKSDLSTQHFSRYQLNSVTGAIIDSATVDNNIAGKMTLPKNFGVGASFGKVDKWTVGGDFTYLDFRTFNGFTNSIGIPTIGFRSGIGGEFTPDILDFSNYLNRITYRIGAAYEKSPYLVNGNPLMDRGVTFGFTLPVGGWSTVDLGFKVGKRGIVFQNLIEENYFRVYFGVTFNDRWFIKRKFD
jgi:hypothetical protein